MKRRQWQDWVNVLIGVWVVLSPWALGFTEHETAAPVAWVIGAAVVVFAGIGAYLHQAWEEALNIVLGICLLGSPWALGFSDQSSITASAVISGLLVVAFGVLAMLREMDLKKWSREEHQAHGTR